MQSAALMVVLLAAAVVFGLIWQHTRGFYTNDAHKKPDECGAVATTAFCGDDANELWLSKVPFGAALVSGLTFVVLAFFAYRAVASKGGASKADPPKVDYGGGDLS